MNSQNMNVGSVNVNKDNNNLFGSYVRNSCAQQTTGPTQRQHFLHSGPYGVQVTQVGNNVSHMYNTQNQPIYNIMYPPSVSVYSRGQNTFSSLSQNTWQDACKTNNYKQKYDTKKENCYLETKSFYNYNKNSLLDPQWYYGNYDGQKYTELPSCSQITSENCCNLTENNVKSVKYCSIQKLPEVESKLLPYPKQYDSNVYLNQYDKLTKEYSSCSQFSQSQCIYPATCSEVDKKLTQCDMNICNIPNQYYLPTNHYTEVAKTLEKPEENGNESDIIVENSDEDSDDSEMYKEENKCLVCNVHIEKMSYDITLEQTVTSYTRTKVSEKLFQILGWITIENQPKLICNLCMTLLNNLDNLEMQIESMKEKILEKYRTNKLGLNKINKEEQIQRKTLKRRSLVFKCRICKKIISFKMFYKYHLQKHKTRLYKCKYCRKKFVTLTAFRSHINIHKTEKLKLTTVQVDLKTPKLFICHICGKTFKTNSNLKDHEHLCSGKLPYNCINCEKNFPSVSKLNQHNRLFHEKKYTEVCKICNKGFIKNSEYKKHMLTHSTEKTFKCNVCNKIYKTLSNLNQHKKIHSEKLPFSCNNCHKSFLRKENLESHLNNHNGIKPYNCSVCHKTFSTQKYLDAHVKIHDENVKKKTCHICGKQVKHSLEEHLKIHSSVKDYECSTCLMKFLTKGALAKHTKRKHQ